MTSDRVMRLRVFCVMLGPRLRLAWYGSPLGCVPVRAGRVAAVLAAAAVLTAGFGMAVVMARHGPCVRSVSAVGKPHWVLSCGRRP